MKALMSSLVRSQSLFWASIGNTTKGHPCWSNAPVKINVFTLNMSSRKRIYVTKLTKEVYSEHRGKVWSYNVAKRGRQSNNFTGKDDCSRVQHMICRQWYGGGPLDRWKTCLKKYFLPFFKIGKMENTSATLPPPLPLPSFRVEFLATACFKTTI